jgi:hypothetical protein
MSNKLVKHGLSSEQMNQQMLEQRAQYACIFALASKFVQLKGNVVVVSADEINQANTKIIRFEAVNEDGSPFNPNVVDTRLVQPYGVKIWLEDPMAQNLEPKGLDA